MAEKLASKCPHIDRPEKAKGLCQPCYRAHMKAQQIEKGQIRVDEETGVDAKTGEDIGFPDDKEAEKELKRILWKWIREGEEKVEYVDANGKRDYKTETRMEDLRAQMAMKAATILSRGLIGEKKSDVTPESLPGQDYLNNIARQWMVASSIQPTPRQKASLGDIEDDVDDKHIV